MSGESLKSKLEGKIFGRLTVIKLSGVNEWQSAVWKCKCECGNITTATSGSLNQGRKRSCGCLHDDVRKTATRTHGLTKTKEYRAWSAAIQRCYNKNLECYPRYGGRGIRVCERWLNSFENFLEDMGMAPTKDHSLDRFPDNNGHYGPTNCRWATIEEQTRNRRSSAWHEWDGKKMILQDWANQIGITIWDLSGHLSRGKNIGEIINFFNKKKNGKNKLANIKN